MLQAGFRNALDLNPGFRTDHLMMMSTDTSFVRYTPVQTRDFYRHLVDRARALPGVASVALTSAIPLDPNDPPGIEAVIPEGYQFPRGQESVSVRAAAVDEHVFQHDGHRDCPRTRVHRRRHGRLSPGGHRQRGVRQDVLARSGPDRKTDPPDRQPGAVARGGGRGRNRQVQFHQRTADAVLLQAVCTRRAGGRCRCSSKRRAPMRPPSRRRCATSCAPSTRISRSSAFGRCRALYEQQAIAAPLLMMQTTGTMGALGLTLALIGLYGLVAYSVARRTQGDRHPHGDRRGTVGRAEDGLAARA